MEEGTFYAPCSSGRKTYLLVNFCNGIISVPTQVNRNRFMCVPEVIQESVSLDAGFETVAGR